MAARLVVVLKQSEHDLEALVRMYAMLNIAVHISFSTTNNVFIL